MQTHFATLVALIAATPIVFGATLAEPVSSLPAVAVSASKPDPDVRFDIQAACPAIEAKLRASLEPAWTRLQQPTTMHVGFRVEGREVTRVSAWGSSDAYRPAVRRAMTRLECNVGSSAPQDFEFLLVIHAPNDDAPDTAGLALLQP